MSKKITLRKMFRESVSERRADLDRRLEEIRTEGAEVRRIMASILEKRADQDRQLAILQQRLERAGLLTEEEKEQRARWEEAVRIGDEVRRIEEEEFIRNSQAKVDAAKDRERRRGVFLEVVPGEGGERVERVAGVRRLRSTSVGRGDDEDEFFDAQSGGGGGGGGGAGGAGGRRGPEGPWEIFLAFVQILLLVSKNVFLIAILIYSE